MFAQSVVQRQASLIIDITFSSSVALLRFFELATSELARLELARLELARLDALYRRTKDIPNIIPEIRMFVNPS